MKRNFVATLLALLLSAAAPPSSAAQDAILRFTGSSSIEELEESEYERLESMLQHPLRINTASLETMTGSGLMTPFQAASVEDYRKSHGDILSYMELSSIDGFTKDYAERIAPFISLVPRGKVSDHTGHEAVLRASLKGWGVKYRIRKEGRYSISSAVKASDGWRPDTWSGAATAFWRRGKVTIGDFNARFGQGLSMWSGFSLSGVGTADAFRRRPCGISPTWTFGTSRLRGIAGDMTFGNVRVSVLGATNALDRPKDVWAMPAANVSWAGRRAEAGVTGWWRTDGSGVVSSDFGLNLGKVDVFGEAGIDVASHATAGIIGAMWSPAWQRKYSIIVRAYPVSFSGINSGSVRSGTKSSGEYALAIGTKRKWLDLTVDGAWLPAKGYVQVKALAKSTINVSRSVSIIPRASLRVRKEDTRSDARVDIAWAHGAWTATWRSNAVHSRSWGQLHYAEGGYKGRKLVAWARVTGFAVDNWDDRIYCYERDAPGNFNVPAYHGRGIAVSAVAGYRTRRSSLYLRASYIKYFNDKPARSEAKLQYMLNL